LKKLTYFVTGVVVAAMFVLPAAAQKSRGNNGANEPHGKERAEEVQLQNKGTVAPGVEKAESKDKKKDGKHKHKGWFRKGKHKAEGDKE
jgi:hypothetical protein